MNDDEPSKPYWKLKDEMQRRVAKMSMTTLMIWRDFYFQELFKNE